MSTNVRLSLALATACALVVVGACSGDSDEDVDQANPVAQDTFEPATCLDFPPTQGAEIDVLPVVDCSVPHTHEVFHVVEYGAADEYPGFADLEARARTECFTQFEEFVGINVVDSTLFYTWIVPTIESWNDADDRETLCLLGSRDNLPLEESMRDKKL